MKTKKEVEQAAREKALKMVKSSRERMNKLTSAQRASLEKEARKTLENDKKNTKA